MLDQALRHAPDASADASAALSNAILRRARSAVARPVDAVAAPAAARPAPRRRSHPRRSAWACWRWQRDWGIGTGTGVGTGMGTSTGTGTHETQAMSPNLQRWLADADRVTASLWRPAVDGAARAGPPALRLLRDGVLQATLSFGPAVFIETAGDTAPKTSTAALSPSALDALTKAPEEATR